MKTFVVISDSHGRRGAMEKVQSLFSENDYIVHLGDGSSDMRPVLSAYPEKAIVLRGNCDFSFGEDERVIDAEGVRILCCHGHKYSVKSNLWKLALRARELGCSVALYGHTHIASIDRIDGVLLVNPGALGDYVSPSYCYLVVHGGAVTPTIVPL